MTEKTENTETEKSLDQRNEEVIEEIFRLLNYMTNEKELTNAFNDKISRQHRTLQQNFFRMINLIVATYADNSDKIGCDARNEASVAWAKEVKKIEKFMPFI